jgi:hypothetical protein
VTLPAGSSPPQTGPITRIEAELEGAWRERRWGAFLRTCVLSIALTAAIGFFIPVIMLGTYTLFMLIIGTGARIPNLWSVCAWIAGYAGMVTLVMTVPIMALKSLQGGPRS